MYISVPIGRSRIGGGPLFWLIAGPVILEFYVLAFCVKLLILAFGFSAKSIRGSRRHTPAPKPSTRRPAPIRAPAAQPEDAVPPGYMQRRDRQW